MSMGALRPGRVFGGMTASGELLDQPASLGRTEELEYVRRALFFIASNDARRAILPKPWAELDERALCTPKPWEEFFEFLANEYISPSGQNAGDFLDHGSAEGYFNSALKQTSARFK